MIKIRTTTILILLGIISLMLLFAYTATADRRDTVPNVLPNGTNVRAIVINYNHGISDPFSRDIISITTLVLFQDIDNNSGSELHYIDANINYSKPIPMQEMDLIDSIEYEANSLNYNLKEVIYSSSQKQIIRNR